MTPEEQGELRGLMLAVQIAEKSRAHKTADRIRRVLAIKGFVPSAALAEEYRDAISDMGYDPDAVIKRYREKLEADEAHWR